MTAESSQHMRKTWRIKDPNPSTRNDLAAALGVSPITAQLLINRGIDDIKSASDFLNCSLSACHDPFLLKDMNKAVSRIKDAISSGEKILVYGDYDVDGMTGVAVLSSALKKLGADIETYIPNRLEEGYGLNMGAIKRAHSQGVKLIVTVDCGISSLKEIEYAKNLHIDAVITDHHEIPGASIPKAHAVVNAMQSDCRYPFKHLAGVGVAYKLVAALFDGTGFSADEYLDLVSLGTVADVVPLVGENRILSKHGLELLGKCKRPGLRALMDVTGLTGKDISSGHIGFILGPRINAMGRVGSPQKALELLLSDDEAASRDLAKMLDSENRSRQKIESGILDMALSKVDREVNFKYHRVIVLASEGWHPGVIGIVASRIADRFYRPTIVISLDGKMGKGSGRSIEGFHLFDYLFRCKDLLAGFGGHESACGITIEKNKIDAFRDRINEEAAKDMREEIYSPKLDIDMDVPLNMITEDVIGQIESLAPFGEENPRPVLASKNITVKDGPWKIGKNGFKILVTDNNITCEAVSFGRSVISKPETGAGVDLAYIPSINDWQGLQSIQLELRDIK